MTAFMAIPPSVPSGHLPLKGGDRTAHAAAPCGKLDALCAQLTTGGHGWRGKLPISHLEGATSAKLTEGGESHGRQNGGGKTSVH
jgi:hypothetical protein